MTVSLAKFIAQTRRLIAASTSLLVVIFAFSLLCSVNATAQTPAGTVIVNVAHGSFSYHNGRVDSLVTDTARTLITPSGKPSLVLIKSADRPLAQAGTILTYTIQVRDTGREAATAVVIADTLPANTTLVSASAGSQVNGSLVQWTIPVLHRDSMATVTLRVNVNNGYQGDLLNTAFASCAEGDRVSSNTVRTGVTSFVATSISMVSMPGAIPGNGRDTANLQATIADRSGAFAPDGTPVRFTTARGKFQNNADTITASTMHGIATAILRSETVSLQNIAAGVSGVTINSEGVMLKDTSTVYFYVAAISGVVTDAQTKKPVTGALVQAMDEANREAGRDSSKSDGGYVIPIQSPGTYSVLITIKNSIGDNVIVKTSAKIGALTSGGSSPVLAGNSIVGTLLNTTGKAWTEANVGVKIQPQSMHKVVAGYDAALSDTQTVFTDAHGNFQFTSLIPGFYEIRIVSDEYQGSLNVVDTVPGVLVLNSNIMAEEIPKLTVTITSNKRVAEIGEVVGYTIEVANQSKELPFTHVTVVDTLAAGFGYMKGSSIMGTTAVADPSGSRVLVWQLPDSLLPGQSVKVLFRSVAGAAAMEGTGTTRAMSRAITPGGSSIQSLPAELSVTVRPGVFTNHAVVLGKIFMDLNKNGRQDEGEEGLPGVELWLEDGTRVVTGDDGKYSLPDVLPGERVVRVNRRTLPVGSHLMAHGTNFAGDEVSRFLELSEGGIARADFYALPPTQAELHTSVRNPNLDKAGASSMAIFVIRQDEFEKTKSISIVDTLPAGYSYDLTSVTVHDSAIKVEGKKTQTLSLQLRSLLHSKSDTVIVKVVADSNGLAPLVIHPRLILAYPTGRDAVFKSQPLSSFDSQIPYQLDGWGFRRWFARKQDENSMNDNSRYTG